MSNEQNNEVFTYKDVMNIEKQFRIGNEIIDSIGHKIIPGDKKSKVMISVPHSVTSYREGKVKNREFFLGTLAFLIQQKTKCHLIYKTSNLNDDANYDEKSNYKEDLVKYVKDNNIEIVLDLHGLNSFRKDIEFGTFYGKTIKNNYQILRSIYDILLDNRIYSISLDKDFWAGGETIAHTIAEQTKAIAIQFEISTTFRNPQRRFSQFEKIIKALTEIVKELNGEDIYEIEENNEKSLAIFSDILDFQVKKARYKNIPDNYIGMELEMGLNYSRNEYSFIRKHVKKLKNIVNGNGIFMRDFTIVSSYPIEIALDPLSVENMVKIYKNVKDLIKSSSNHLYTGSKYKCGIHLNFNKPKRMKDLRIAHKRLVNYIMNNPEYFVYSKYKKGKILTDYDKYFKNQEEITDKYLFINYRKKGIIEIRNVKPEITPRQLEDMANELLYILYDIEQNSYTPEIDFVAIFDSLFSKITKEKIKKIKENNEFTVYNIDKKVRIK